MEIFVLEISSFIPLRYFPFEETLHFTEIKLTFSVFFYFRSNFRFKIERTLNHPDLECYPIAVRTVHGRGRAFIGRC